MNAGVTIFYIGFICGFAGMVLVILASTIRPWRVHNEMFKFGIAAILVGCCCMLLLLVYALVVVLAGVFAVK